MKGDISTILSLAVVVVSAIGSIASVIKKKISGQQAMAGEAAGPAVPGDDDGDAFAEPLGSEEGGAPVFEGGKRLQPPFGELRRKAETGVRMEEKPLEEAPSVKTTRRKVTAEDLVVFAAIDKPKFDE